MTLDEYDEKALSTASYPQVGDNIIYPVLKLNGEAGEVAEKVGKYWRNFDKIKVEDYSSQQREDLLKELGDVLWYISATAMELKSSLQEVAEINISKLQSRSERNVIKSEGDNR